MTEIGWREYVNLPELGISNLAAKIDTGARTSALHATQIRPYQKQGEDWIEFLFSSDEHMTERCHAPLVEYREVKNTGGVPESRPIIKTLLVINGRRWRIEVSLTDRENMGYELILGRTAVRRRKLHINPGKSWLTGKPSANSS